MKISGKLQKSMAALLFAIVATGDVLAANQDNPSPAMAGHWEGTARIVVNWTQQQTMPVQLDIRPDGQVTGRVGDATLSNARLTRNRGALGRALHLKTDYIVRGDLAGPVIAAEGISRSGVSMPLNFRNGSFAGGLHTSGSKLGGKAHMILSAGLTLTNAPVTSAPAVEKR